MIEPIMYFGVGFLVAALIGLIVIPLVHGRAVRLTMRRLEAATPLSMAEIQADKDQLRAEFAMSMRRLEMSAEQLKNKTTSQLAELGRKGDAINRLKIELGEKTAAVFALESRDRALRDELQAAEEERAATISTLRQTERTLADRQTEVGRLKSEVDDRSSFANAQKVEIVALNTQVEQFRAQLADAVKEAKVVEDRRNAERARFKATAQELDDERGKVESLGRRLSELGQQLAARTNDVQMLQRRAQELEARLGEQSRLLARGETDLVHLRAELEASRKSDADLRAAITDITTHSNGAVEALQFEKTELQSELHRAVEARALLTRELADTRREHEKAAASERAENALLRERIGDVAAEVARLASALEGPNSPINAILAEEPARGRGNSGTAAINGGPERPQAREANGNLADRIRALQSQASRPQRGGPARRN